MRVPFQIIRIKERVGPVHLPASPIPSAKPHWKFPLLLKALGPTIVVTCSVCKSSLRTLHSSESTK
jgi:hypothetical protein